MGDHARFLEHAATFERSLLDVSRKNEEEHNVRNRDHAYLAERVGAVEKESVVKQERLEGIERSLNELVHANRDSSFEQSLLDVSRKNEEEHNVRNRDHA